MSIVDGKEICGTFYEKELQKTNQKEFRVERVIKRKGNKYVKWKRFDNSFNSWIDKRDIYFPTPKSFEGRVKVELALSNSATKADLKIATPVDISKFAKKVDLANIKSDVDKLDIGKLILKNIPNNLSNLKSEVDKLDV